jgi:glycosyltransferase involved in cell wall biosynthesis
MKAAVHIHISYPYLKALLSSGYRQILFTHHGYAPWYMVPGFRNKIIHLGLRTLYKRLLRKLPFIIAISNYVKRQIEEMYNITAKVIYNGVDTSIFRHTNASSITIDADFGHPIIVNVGAHDKLKGLDILIRDFELIKEHYPNASLLLVKPLNPDGWTRNYLKKVVEKIEGVYAFPYKSQEYPVRLYNMADLYLLTSRWESFCLPMIESFACGVPVVAYDKDDARKEHIENSKAGRLYSDKKSLLESIEDVLKRRDFYSKKALRYARSFDWSEVTREYIKAYEEVISN